MLAINPDDFTVFRDRSQLAGDIIDEGSQPDSSDFHEDVDGAARVRGEAIDIGPFEFA